MCDKATIDAIAEYAVSPDGADITSNYRLGIMNRMVDDTPYDTIGRTLTYANAMGQMDRYKDDESARVREYRWQPARKCSTVEMAKLLNCFEYQASEWSKWESSTAAKIVDACRCALLRSLPGYGAAPWGLDNIGRVATL